MIIPHPPALLFALAAVFPVQGPGALSETRHHLDETLWSPEIQAQEHEDTFVELWDELRAAQDPFAVLEAFPFGRIRLGRPAGESLLDLGIRRTDFGSAGAQTLDPDAFGRLLAEWKAGGWRLAASEWHHARFEAAADGPARSTVAFKIHALRAGRKERVILKGSLQVTWADTRGAGGRWRPEEIDATQLTVLQREGDAFFEEVASLRPAQPVAVQQVIVVDLDDDGLPEIIPAMTNLLLRNLGGGRFQGEALFPSPAGRTSSSVVADFDGDARPDFLCVGTGGEIRLYRGEPGGRFAPEPAVSTVEPPIQGASCITAGDPDGDGDLDLWIGAYLLPYRGGQMPTPYYDSNDGLPSFHLRNDGNGSFSDATGEAGLGSKRRRRTYSASFVDLDEDGDQDLMVVNDFAGVDLWKNDGSGRFEDATAEWVDERHTFGMSHAFGDFDRDGRLDFYVTGMGSTTARRLEQMGLGRDDFPDRTRLRAAMGYGNRMYLRRGDRYEPPPYQDSVARTGWSWGCGDLDFDNDGDADLYVANGHISGASAKDYCTTFWRHDIYTGGSEPDPAVQALFQAVREPVNTRRISWNGFEHNNLLVNLGTAGFVNAAFLFGVAFEFDSRAVVAADLDADGRVDLVVVERERDRQRLHLLLNRGATEGHWIGARLAEEPGHHPIGARVTIKTARGLQTDLIATGDSFMSQLPFMVHFGLGPETEVEWLEVRWADGAVRRLENPRPGRYHRIRAGAAAVTAPAGG